MTESVHPAHNLAVSYPAFPLASLSRRPALMTGEEPLDSTLRDPMENGMQTARIKWTRERRKFPVSFNYFTPADKLVVDAFVQTVQQGALPFTFTDPRDKTGATVYTVQFSVIPKYRDAGWVDGFFRQNMSAELTEV